MAVPNLLLVTSSTGEGKVNGTTTGQGSSVVRFLPVKIMKLNVVQVKEVSTPM